MMTCTVRLSEMTTHCCMISIVPAYATDWSAYDRGLSLELGVAQNGSSGVVENVEERYCDQSLACRKGMVIHIPRGFFFKTRNTVSMSSTYLM